MNILILDDDEYRHEVFSGRYRDDWVVSVLTYGAFVKQLESGVKWDLVHLDHDLGDLIEGDKYVDGWGGTREYNGLDASRRICELEDSRLPSRVIIQSVNPDGARGMLQTLTRRGVPTTWEPFSVGYDDLDDQTVDQSTMTFAETPMKLIDHSSQQKV